MNYVESALSAFHNDLETHEENCRILGVCIIVPAMIDREERKIVSTVLKESLPENAIEALEKSFSDDPLVILNELPVLHMRNAVITGWRISTLHW